MPYLSLYISYDRLDGYTSSKHVRDFSIEESDKAQILYETLVACDLRVYLEFREGGPQNECKHHMWVASARYTPTTGSSGCVYAAYKSVSLQPCNSLIPLIKDGPYLWLDVAYIEKDMVNLLCYHHNPVEAYSILTNYVSTSDLKEKITPLLPDVVIKPPKLAEPFYYTI